MILPTWLVELITKIYQRIARSNWNFGVDALTTNRTATYYHYHWFPAEPDDRLYWLVMVGAACVVYALAGVVCFIWR